MKKKFVKAVGQRGEGGTDFVGVHPKSAVHAPECFRRGPGGREAAAGDEEGIKEAPGKRRIWAANAASLAETDPASKIRTNGFPQCLEDVGVRVEVMMRIDEFARQSSTAKLLPLRGHLPAHELACAAGNTNGYAGGCG